MQAVSTMHDKESFIDLDDNIAEWLQIRDPDEDAALKAALKELVQEKKLKRSGEDRWVVHPDLLEHEGWSKKTKKTTKEQPKKKLTSSGNKSLIPLTQKAAEKIIATKKSETPADFFSLDLVKTVILPNTIYDIKPDVLKDAFDAVMEQDNAKKNENTFLIKNQKLNNELKLFSARWPNDLSVDDATDGINDAEDVIDFADQSYKQLSDKQHKNIDAFRDDCIQLFNLIGYQPIIPNIGMPFDPRWHKSSDHDANDTDLIKDVNSIGYRSIKGDNVIKAIVDVNHVNAKNTFNKAIVPDDDEWDLFGDDVIDDPFDDVDDLWES